jgi:hypothetical protein
MRVPDEVARLSSLLSSTTDIVGVFRRTRQTVATSSFFVKFLI